MFPYVSAALALAIAQPGITLWPVPRSSLVGREQELAAIERFLERASDASATALVIEGERVAELAAVGLKNREVAAQLFMSPKTVEANLARAYRKLGIRSRAELGARLGEERASAQT